MNARSRYRFRPEVAVLEDRSLPGSLPHVPTLGVFADLVGKKDHHALLSGAASHLSGQPGDHANPGVFSIHSHPHGMTYGQWSAAWWQWATSLPADHHPLFDTADLGTGQSGHVWFLGGTFFSTATPTGDFVGVANRSGRVPVGTALFFPILNTECSTAEGNGTTEAELRACAKGLVDGTTSLTATIDGRPVGHLFDQRAASPLFTYGPVPNNNIFQALGANVPPGTTSPSVADGYYLMLRPLPVGQHTIHFSGSQVIGHRSDGSPVTSSLDITYHLTVVPAGHDR
jgi:hypothetical protein